MIKMTRELGIQFNSAASIADRIGSHPQIQGLRLLKMRLQRGLQQDPPPEMVTSEEGEAIRRLHEGVIGIPPQENGVLRPLGDVGVVPHPRPDAAGLLLPDGGHHLHLSEDDPHPLDDTLHLSSAAIAHPLCHLKKENCLVLRQGVLLQEPNADPPGLPKEGVLHLKGAALLPLQHLRPDTGGARCTLLVEQKGIAVRLLLQQIAVAIQEVLPAHTAVLKLHHPTIENQGLQITKQFEEYLELQNLAMFKELQ